VVDNDPRPPADTIKRLRALLKEAADTVRAAQAEDGITSARRDYRADLERRIREELAK